MGTQSNLARGTAVYVRTSSDGNKGHAGIDGYAGSDISDPTVCVYVSQGNGETDKRFHLWYTVAEARELRAQLDAAITEAETVEWPEYVYADNGTREAFAGVDEHGKGMYGGMSGYAFTLAEALEYANPRPCESCDDYTAKDGVHTPHYV